MNIYQKFMELANSCEDYDDFEKQAMEATPDHLKESFGSHMLEWYIEFRYIRKFDDKDSKPQEESK